MIWGLLIHHPRHQQLSHCFSSKYLFVFHLVLCFLFPLFSAGLSYSQPYRVFHPLPYPRSVKCFLLSTLWCVSSQPYPSDVSHPPPLFVVFQFTPSPPAALNCFSPTQIEKLILLLLLSYQITVIMLFCWMPVMEDFQHRDTWNNIPLVLIVYGKSRFPVRTRLSSDFSKIYFIVCIR